MDDVGKRGDRGLQARVAQQERETLDAHRESACRRLVAAKLREKKIIAAATGDRSLRAEAIGNPLEYGSVVVVEAANEPGIYLEGDVGFLEQRLKLEEMLSRLRLRVEMIVELRRPGNDRLHLGVLAVENSQRIGVDATLRALVELVEFGLKIRRERIAV